LLQPGGQNDEGLAQARMPAPTRVLFAHLHNGIAPFLEVRAEQGADLKQADVASLWRSKVFKA